MNPSQMVASSALYVAWRGLAAASVHLEAHDTQSTLIALEAVSREVAKARASLDPSGLGAVNVPMLRPSTR